MNKDIWPFFRTVFIQGFIPKGFFFFFFFFQKSILKGSFLQHANLWKLIIANFFIPKVIIQKVFFFFFFFFSKQSLFQKVVIAEGHYSEISNIKTWHFRIPIFWNTIVRNNTDHSDHRLCGILIFRIKTITPFGTMLRRYIDLHSNEQLRNGYN